MRLAQHRPWAAVAAAVAVTFSLSACSDSGDAVATERFGEGVEGFKAASKALATAVADQDGAAVCAFLNAEHQSDITQDTGVSDCASAVESRMSEIPEDVRASWASVDFGPTEAEERNPSEYCWPRTAEFTVGEGPWADDSPRASTFPCLLYSGESWTIDSDGWVLDFHRAGT